MDSGRKEEELNRARDLLRSLGQTFRDIRRLSDGSMPEVQVRIDTYLGSVLRGWTDQVEGRPPRAAPSLKDRMRELRNRHRMRVEAAGPRRAEEARQVAANRRVISGDVVEYDASTRTATVELPGGETIRGRTIGRGAPIGKVVVTIPLGSSVATIQAPEPRC